MKKGTAPDGENGWQVNGEVTAAEIAIEEAIKAGARSLEIRYDRKSARKPRADEVVRGQCGLQSINLKRAAMPHVSFWARTGTAFICKEFFAAGSSKNAVNKGFSFILIEKGEDHLSPQKGGHVQMEIITCYTADIRKQLTDKGERQVNDRLMKMTAGICLKALKYCTDTFLSEWDCLSGLPSSPKSGVLCKKSAANALIHSTKGHPAKYPQFDRDFQNFPSYTRRTVVADALGKVSSYVSNHRNWEKQDPQERGTEPALGLPDRYSLTFYDQERDLCDIEKGIVGLKLFNGKAWGWHYFKISPSDARYILAVRKTRKMLSPVVEKVKGKYRIRFSFKEDRALVQDKNRFIYRILAVDLGINAAASWCIMEADGTVHGKGVIRLTCEEDRLNHLINRKRMYQQAGKKPKGIYRMITAANRALSIETCKKIMETAVLYDVDCIVFEYLDSGKVKGGGRYKERIHMWRKRDVQKRTELQAHRHGMRISRVCAWGTSKYAFDGSGEVERGKDAGFKTYSICRFKNGKTYNCDLSAAQNIGARYFLREYTKLDGCPKLPCTPQRTYSTLYRLISDLKDKAA